MLFVDGWRSCQLRKVSRSNRSKLKFDSWLQRSNLCLIKYDILGPKNLNTFQICQFYVLYCQISSFWAATLYFYASIFYARYLNQVSIVSWVADRLVSWNKAKTPHQSVKSLRNEKMDSNKLNQFFNFLLFFQRICFDLWTHFQTEEEFSCSKKCLIFTLFWLESFPNFSWIQFFLIKNTNSFHLSKFSDVKSILVLIFIFSILPCFPD